MQVSFGLFSKKRNSTKRPTTELSDTRTVKLKQATSLDAPTFILTGNNFNWNYAQYGSRYYFITDIRSLHNNESEIECVLDPLATGKDYILNSTQYVCYSNVSGGAYLPDTRLPVLAKGIGTYQDIVNPHFSRSGSYILSVNGQNGCELYRVTRGQLQQLLNNINTWFSDARDAFLNGLIDPTPTDDIVVALKNTYTVLARSGAFGNAYSEAPNCIRSCIWVPFDSGVFDVTSNKEIYLGQFPTGVWADAISSTPYMDTFTFNIDWHYNDWRRSKCEDIYIYLPLVGVSAINSENIASNNTITIKYSLSPTDGAVAYELISGVQIIGTYGASCAANYPIGISQQASAGEIISSILNGTEKIFNSAINSSISPLSMGAASVGMAFQGINATYNSVTTINSRHNTTIGGIGGGVGSGLDLFARVYHVYHETVIDPSQMQSTMGLPTMKPLQLSSLTGYCQCANAHVEAPLMAYELDAIDAYLNSGFFIE